MPARFWVFLAALVGATAAVAVELGYIPVGA